MTATTSSPRARRRGAAERRRRARRRADAAARRRHVLLARDGRRGAQRRRRRDGAVGVVGRVARPTTGRRGTSSCASCCGRALGVVGLRRRDPRRLPRAGAARACRCWSSAPCCSCSCSSPASASTSAGRAAGSALGCLRFQPRELAKLALLLYARRPAQPPARPSVGDWRRGAAPGRCSCSARSRCLVMRRARPRLDAGARRSSSARCSSSAASGCRHLAVRRRRSASPWSTLLAVAEPYRRARLLTFLDPFGRPVERRLPDRRSRSSRSAAAGWTGVGLGAGRAKWLFLPERPHRLHLRHHRRGARAGRLRCSCSCSSSRFARARHPRRAARPRPVRHAARRRRSPCGSSGQAVINIGAVDRRCCRSPASRCRSCRSAARRSSSRWSRPACSPTSPARRR